MVERFFLTNKRSFQFQLPAQPDPIILLSGPPSSGKTSLLFQFAFNSALAGNGAVVILCNRRRLEMNPPFLSQGVDPSSEIFQRIQMKYVDDDEGIKNYFSAFHLNDKFPASIIIDDFANFFDESKKGSCELLLSDTHKGDTPRLLYIYKRWISCIYTIKEGDGSGSFILNKKFSDTSNGKSMRSAKYSIALQYLVLEALVEGVEH